MSLEVQLISSWFKPGTDVSHEDSRSVGVALDTPIDILHEDMGTPFFKLSAVQPLLERQDEGYISYHEGYIGYHEDPRILHCGRYCLAAQLQTAHSLIAHLNTE